MVARLPQTVPAWTAPQRMPLVPPTVADGPGGSSARPEHHAALEGLVSTERVLPGRPDASVRARRRPIRELSDGLARPTSPHSPGWARSASTERVRAATVLR